MFGRQTINWLNMGGSWLANTGRSTAESSRCLVRCICTSKLVANNSKMDSHDSNEKNAGGDGLLLERPSKHVAHLQLNRPKVKNAFCLNTARDFQAKLDSLDEDPTIRCVVLSGNGPDFTSGVDLKSFMSLYGQLQETEDIGRKGKLIHGVIEQFQAPFKRMYKFNKPIICVQHGLSLGLGMELAACSDIRYCSRDARLAIREVLIGIAADVGSLQLLPRLTSNQSLLNELIFTGRHMTIEEALKLAFISKVFESKAEAIEHALETANTIARRSPVAVQGSKRNLRFSEDKTLLAGLDYNAIWNMSMMQSEDVSKAIGAILNKQIDDVDYDNY